MTGSGLVNDWDNWEVDTLICQPEQVDNEDLQYFLCGTEDYDEDDEDYYQSGYYIFPNLHFYCSGTLPNQCVRENVSLLFFKLNFKLN